MAQLEIKCPLCKGTIWIDQSTGKIIDHKEAGHKKVEFSDFLKDSKKDKGWDEKMKKAREEEARRKAEREKLFKEARANPDKLKSDGRPDPFMWD